MSRKKTSPFYILKPTKQRTSIPYTIGFDIETCEKNKKFVCASLVGDNFKNIYYTKDSFIKAISHYKYRNCYLCASNLAFDFFGLFYNDERIKQFNTLFRGSQLILCWTYVKNGKFYRKKIKGARRLNFIDTFNYAPFPVVKLGKIIGIEKLDTPKFIGQYPKNKTEWDYLIKYNIRDSEVSKKFMDFLFEALLKLGATPKITIASSSMSLFKNKYLKDDYFRATPSELLEMFNAYYGGRTEVFSRGTIKDYNYYDFNSLYPDVMRGKYPDPNSKRINFKNTTKYIKKYEGCAKVKISVPKMKYPPLPVKAHKVIFPYGTIKGWWTNNELRYALTLGCEIKKVYKSYYFLKTCRPFKRYVTDLYNLRLKYKADKSPMEVVVKLLMNSLYGKFGQKFIDRDNVVPFNHTPEELGKLEWFERIGDFLRIKQSFSEPPSYTIPIWASYTTSYARIKLHQSLVKYNPVYCDTDSILTKYEAPTSDALGELKLEMGIYEGILVKPKFYALKQKRTKDKHSQNSRPEYVKIKGLGVRIAYLEFFTLTKKYKFIKSYDKFTKFKEAIRRGLIPNEIIQITKHLTLEDDKRIWKNKKFDPDIYEESKPIHYTPEIFINNSSLILKKREKEDKK